MPNDQYQYESIGVIRTPFESPEGMPIQPAGADTVEGTVKVTDSYLNGLQDLNGFSHCILLYHFHAAADAASFRLNRFLMKNKEASLPPEHHSARIKSASLLLKLIQSQDPK